MSRTVAVLAAVVGVLGEAVAVAVQTGDDRWNELAFAPVPIAYAAVGLLITWHRPAQPVGRLALVLAPAWGVGEALVAVGYTGLADDPADRAAALASTLGGFLRGLPWLVAVLLLPLRFPDGRPEPPTRLHRLAERLALTTLVAFSASSLFAPKLTDLRVDEVDNPLGLPGVVGALVGGLAALSILLGAVAIGLAVACLVQRYRRGGALGRQQTLIFGAAFLPPVAALAASMGDAAGPWLFGIASLPVPVAIGVAVLQRRLYDIPLALNRSLTYGGLWIAIAVLYAVTVGGVGAMVRDRGAAWLPWLAAGVVAVSFAPLRDALQRAANKLTFGQWSRPEEVLARTSRRLADVGDQRALLGSLAAELSAELSLGEVRISGADGELLASAGTGTGPSEELPLVAYGATVGTLAWTARPLRDADRAFLGTLASQLGSVVHAHRLLGRIRVAQERLVIAREEERRRLRRDLHDGLGPALAGLSLRVDTLRNELADPLAEERLLALRGGIQETVDDVRRLVEGLRPASLDDLGLVESLHQVALRLGGGAAPEIAVDAAPLPALPAAVEVAAFRIAQEALTNAVRHAGARRVRLALCAEDGTLRVLVADDGRGVVDPRPDGVGLGSMRDRAEEVGGSFELEPVPGAGTTVTAVLPLTGPAS